MYRRDFLLTLGITLISASAYSFGESIQVETKKSDKIALLHMLSFDKLCDLFHFIKGL